MAATPLTLTGAQRKQLYDVLLAAFPTDGDLNQLIYNRLGQTPAAILAG